MFDRIGIPSEAFADAGMPLAEMEGQTLHGCDSNRSNHPGIPGFDTGIACVLVIILFAARKLVRRIFA